jgi:hypothetical protein
MTTFHEQAHQAPPPSPMVVFARHGAKFKVRIFGRDRIMDADTVLKWAADRRKAGAAVELNGFIREPNKTA